MMDTAPYLAPDFFPEGMKNEEKTAYIKKIQAKHVDDQLRASEAMQKLDEKTEQVSRQRELDKRAREIYESGKFPEFLVGEYDKIWCGDHHILKWVICSFTNGWVENSDEGLHLNISGPSGLGKSEGAKAAIKLLPSDYTVSGQFSRKGFLYAAGSFPPGTIVLYDDHRFNEDEAGMYRAIIAGWREKSKYYTVDKQSSSVKDVPERITQVITNADGLSEEGSDGQNESRFVTIEVQRDAATLTKILSFIKEEKASQTTIDMDTIISVWGLIVKERRRVEIPFIKNIQVSDNSITKIREFKKFLSLIRAITLLRGRTIATMDDFKEAQEMWSYLLLMIDNEVPGLHKNEAVVFRKLQELSSGGKRVMLSTLKESLNLPQDKVYKALRGKTGNLQNPSGGLLTKIRGLTVEQLYNKDSGESDRVVTVPGKISIIGESPYSLDGGNDGGL